MPDDPDAPIAGLTTRARAGLVDAGRLGDAALGRGTGGAERLLHRHIDGPELMVAGHLLGKLAGALVLEDDEVADQIQETAMVEDTLNNDLQLWEVGRGGLAAGDGASGLEPLAARSEGADTSLDAVRGNDHGVVGEEAGNLVLIGLELLEVGPDRRVLGSGVLEY